MDTLTFIRTLIGYMHTVIAAGMHPLTGEMAMDEERKRSIVRDTFAEIRKAHAAIVAASVEADDVKTKREAAHKTATAKFVALYEAALQTSKVPGWALAYREMTSTAKPAGGDKDTADEIQKLHDVQLKMITETFLVTNPWLAGIESDINRLGTKGRPAGSRNKPKDEAKDETSDAPSDNETETPSDTEVGAQ